MTKVRPETRDTFPVDDVATAVSRPLPAVRAERSSEATSGNPNADATCAWLRVRLQRASGLPPPALHGSATERRYGTGLAQTSWLFSVRPPSEEK